MDNLHYHNACDVINKLRDGSLQLTDLVEQLLERIEEVNSKINALVEYNPSRILEIADAIERKTESGTDCGPLYGLPITIKDNIEVNGMRTTAGILGRKDYVPSYDATVVQRLKDAGALVIGKTNCPAFCAGFETQNDIFGRTNNPYALERTVGSSSGGEAALIAAGGSYFGLGSDSGGSIRWPSSYCGITSLVPTFGRVPRTGTVPPYLGFLDTTQIGPMARSVRDLMLVLPIIMGPDNWDSRCIPMSYDEPDSIGLEGLSVAYYAANTFVEPVSEVAKVIYDSSDYLMSEGVDAEERYPPATTEYIDISRGLNSFASNIDETNEPNIHELDSPVELYPDNILGLADDWLESSKQSTGKNAMLGIEFYFWSIKWDTYRTRMLRFMKEYDAIVCPVSAIPAFLHGASRDKGFNGQNLLSYTHPYSLVGLPSVTLRGGTSSEGLPIGFQIITKHGEEALALRIALYLEKKMGGWKRPPI